MAIARIPRGRVQYADSEAGRGKLGREINEECEAWSRTAVGPSQSSEQRSSAAARQRSSEAAKQRSDREAWRHGSCSGLDLHVVDLDLPLPS